MPARTIHDFSASPRLFASSTPRREYRRSRPRSRRRHPTWVGARRRRLGASITAPRRCSSHAFPAPRFRWCSCRSTQTEATRVPLRPRCPTRAVRGGGRADRRERQRRAQSVARIRRAGPMTVSTGHSGSMTPCGPDAEEARPLGRLRGHADFVGQRRRPSTSCPLYFAGLAAAAAEPQPCSSRATPSDRCR